MRRDDVSAFSVEYTEYASVDPDPATLDYAHANRGAWIEFRTGNVPEVLERLLEAGVPSFAHPASPHVYFSAPGGQVFRILDINYRGP